MPRSLLGRLRSRFGPPIDAVTRREVLQGSIAVGTALLLSGPRVFAKPPKPSSSARVLPDSPRPMSCSPQVIR